MPWFLSQIARPAASWDDKMPRISWRGDGQFFVVSVIHPQTGTSTSLDLIINILITAVKNLARSSKMACLSWKMHYIQLIQMHVYVYCKAVYQQWGWYKDLGKELHVYCVYLCWLRIGIILWLSTRFVFYSSLSFFVFQYKLSFNPRINVI